MTTEKRPESETPTKDTTTAVLAGLKDVPAGVSDDVALAALDGEGRDAIRAVEPEKKTRKRKAPAKKKTTAKRKAPAKKTAAGAREKKGES